MINISLKKSLLGSKGEMFFDLKLQIKKGSFLAVSGESGSGKSTFLRILAGLEEADGSIDVFGQSWLNKKSSLSVQKREIGFVFQDYALFDNMNVLDNLLFVNKDLALAKELLELTELDTLKKRFPKTLSGGQKQRVALCRAFMNTPKLLLMDEPLSALDPKIRAKLQQDISTLHKAFNTTTIMVSHDPSEIYKLADRVVVMDQGKITQDGSPKEILLQTQGSQKFSLHGEIVDIIQADIIFIAIVSIGQQLVEIVLDSKDKEKFSIGEHVAVSTKAFAPSLTSLE